MSMTRKEFLAGVAGGTVVLLFEGCGGGGSSYSGGGMTTTCGATAITGNHGHSLTIPKTDLTSTVDKAYSIAGTAGHDHTVTLTVAQLGQLNAGQNVTVTSSVTNAAGIGSHSHDVTVSCM
ncbi:hypothetical protein [Piscinibacter sp.]|jgi:hypothetical protein|uniref:hypothetical protein n=1 Tax=Piscinibacter sp. TaxID=1903157 RepID=UPI003559FE60